MPKESLQDMQDRIVREAQDKARASHDNIRQATLPLSQVDSIMVKRMVSDADVLANAGKYHAIMDALAQAMFDEMKNE